ncbi:MAG: right-handed parallel beta-helix repeat-containing protein [Phycisphaerae bacterium]|nr:right-handed parallel beta-helix repeat-containing protein [Phycisphaerae bacterium]
MKRQFLMVTTPICIAILLAGAWVAGAGDLNPPAGPVSPTPGPEPRIAINATNTPGDADSVFRIAAPGSYYLTGNLTGVAAKMGIEIAASDVTLDLMGYTMTGVPGSLAGVSFGVLTQKNITIRNGVVRAWGASGLDIFLGTDLVRVESITATNNVGRGISTSGTATVVNCIAEANTTEGILVGPGSTLTGCVAKGNTTFGISAGADSTVTDCAASANATAFW